MSLPKYVFTRYKLIKLTNPNLFLYAPLITYKPIEVYNKISISQGFIFIKGQHLIYY